MKVAQTTVLVLALCGCATEPNKALDFCQDANKTYSDREKIVETLAYLHSHIDDPQMAYYRKIPIYRTIKRTEQPASFADTYIAEHPECCEVHRPATYEQWRKKGMEGKFLGEPGEWVADVAIEKKSLVTASEHRLWADFTVNNCNKVELINRG